MSESTIETSDHTKYDCPQNDYLWAANSRTCKQSSWCLKSEVYVKVWLLWRREYEISFDLGFPRSTLWDKALSVSSFFRRHREHSRKTVVSKGREDSRYKGIIQPFTPTSKWSLTSWGNSGGFVQHVSDLSYPKGNGAGVFIRWLLRLLPGC